MTVIIAALVVTQVLTSPPPTIPPALAPLCEDPERRWAVPQCPAPAPTEGRARPPDWLDRALSDYCRTLGAVLTSQGQCRWAASPWGGTPIQGGPR